MATLDTGTMIFIGLLLIVVFGGSRLMYGYWPWQRDRHWPPVYAQPVFPVELQHAPPLADGSSQPATVIKRPLVNLNIVDDGRDTYERDIDIERGIQQLLSEEEKKWAAPIPEITELAADPATLPPKPKDQP